MDNDLFIEAHIADLHFGVIDPKTQYDILKEQFLDYIYGMDVLDIVSVEGDIFDHKFMANSDAVVYASYFIRNLVDICRIKNAKLILISGTGSHDADQLKLFSPYLMDQTVSVSIVTTVQFLFVRNKKILCIPELYGKGEDYYNHFLNDCGWYDACYMHGTFKGSIVGKDHRDLDSNREPVFDILDFGGCKGPIISGHVHVANTYRRDFYYCGSPLRYRYGEEKEKGFIILLHNIRTRKYLIHYEPIYSFRYDTVNLDKVLDEQPEYIIQYIDNLKSNGIDHLRVIFTKEVLEKINIIKQYYRNNNGVDIQTNFEQYRIQQKLDEIRKEDEQYDYLFDPNISYTAKLVSYINQSEGKEIWTVDSFVKFLKDIEKI